VDARTQTILAKYGLETMAGHPLELLERHLLASHEATAGAKDELVSTVAAQMAALRDAVSVYLELDDRLPDQKPDDAPTAEWDADIAEWQRRREGLQEVLADAREAGQAAASRTTEQARGDQLARVLRIIIAQGNPDGWHVGIASTETGDCIQIEPATVGRMLAALGSPVPEREGE
jgi:hypothetical protein